MPRPRILRILFWVTSVLLVAFVVAAFFLPRQMKVSRAVVISAGPVAVFDKLQSLKQWESWGPWFRRDRFVDKKFDGPESGEGAVMDWKSSGGETGRVKIVSALRPESLHLAVQFTDSGDAETWFELKDAGGGATELTWGFQADFGQNMARRYFGLFAAHTGGNDLEEGLANLKALLEKPVP